MPLRAPTVTAELDVKYMKSVITPQTVWVTAKYLKIDGRKIWLEGTVKDESGTVLATGRSLFLQIRREKLVGWLPLLNGSLVISHSTLVISSEMRKIRVPGEGTRSCRRRPTDIDNLILLGRTHRGWPVSQQPGHLKTYTLGRRATVLWPVTSLILGGCIFTRCIG